HIVAVDDVQHSRRDADFAGGVGLVVAVGVGAAFQPGARNTPRRIAELVGKQVEILVAGVDQTLRRNALGGGQRPPVLGAGVLQVAVGIEQPVALLGDQAVDSGDLAVVH